MKGLIKWITLALILISLVPVVSGFTASNVVIDPSGALEPGKTVTVSYKVQFPSSGDYTFGMDNQLLMSTDLESAKWSWIVVKKGDIDIEEPQPDESGKTLRVGGWLLNYPSSVDLSILVTMQGVVPSVDATTNKTIIRIQEVDSNGNIFESSKVERTAMVININDLKTAISVKKTDLQTFRTHIDEKAAIGIDTSAAEVKYNDANAKISAAEGLPATQYTTAFSYLDTAATLMTDGEKELDKAWAEMEVLNSQIPITNVDNVIAWFMGNKSTASLPELQPIISKREIAVSYISTANDEITSGNYAQARSKAAEAFAKGNESYTEALVLQKKTMSGFDIGSLFSGIFKSGVMLIVVAVVAIVLIAVGVIVYRKRSRWDELG